MGACHDRVREAKEWDESMVKAMEEMRKSSVSGIRGKEWSEEQGLILY
jgi:hypothetical protein